ncbi:MAG: hypothetical protein U1F43_28765 [Myxococcota bacterium]
MRGLSPRVAGHGHRLPGPRDRRRRGRHRRLEHRPPLEAPIALRPHQQVERRARVLLGEVEVESRLLDLAHELGLEQEPAQHVPRLVVGVAHHRVVDHRQRQRRAHGLPVRVARGDAEAHLVARRVALAVGGDLDAHRVPAIAIHHALGQRPLGLVEHRHARHALRPRQRLVLRREVHDGLVAWPGVDDRGVDHLLALDRAHHDVLRLAARDAHAHGADRAVEVVVAPEHAARLARQRQGEALADADRLGDLGEVAPPGGRHEGEAPEPVLQAGDLGHRRAVVVDDATAHVGRLAERILRPEVDARAEPGHEVAALGEE